MGRGRGVLVACVLAAGCGDGVGGGGGSDAAAARDGAAAPPDAAGPEVRFEDRAWGELELLDLGISPEVVIDADGDVMTLWDSPPPSAETRCFARRRSFETSSWGPEHDFVTPEAVRDALESPPDTTVAQAQDYCTYPDSLQIDDAGRAAVVYIHSRDLARDGGGGYLYWSGMRAMFDPASGWTEPEWIGQNSTLSSVSYQIAMNAQGTASLAWTQSRELWAADYQPDDGWQEPLQVEDSEDSITLKDLALDDRGDGLAVFTQAGRLSAARLEDDAWGTPEPVDDPELPIVAGGATRDLAMNGDGMALLVWRRCATPPPDSGNCQLRARRFDPVAGWAAATTLPTVDPTAYVAVAIDAEGNGLAVWAESSADPDGSDLRFARIETARFRDGAWMDPEVLDSGELGDGLYIPRVALDAAGNGLLAWTFSRYWEEGSEEAPHGEIRARSYIPASGFGPPALLEVWDRQISYSVPVIAINRAGFGAAVWGVDDVGRARMFR